MPGCVPLLSRRSNVTALLFLFGVYGFWNLVAGQAGIFMPRVYDAAGLASPAGQNALQVLVWGCTTLATWFGFMRFGDRVDMRRFYAVGAVLGIAAWALLSYGPSTLPVLLGFAVLWGTSAGIGAQAFYSLWTSELFATRYRATAQGLLFFAARCAVGGLSYVFPVLLASQGVPVVGTLLLGFLLVALVVGVVWTPATQGRTLRGRSRRSATRRSRRCARTGRWQSEAMRVALDGDVHQRRDVPGRRQGGRAAAAPARRRRRLPRGADVLRAADGQHRLPRRGGAGRAQLRRARSRGTTPW